MCIVNQWPTETRVEGHTFCSCRISAEIAAQHESSFSAYEFDLDLQNAFLPSQSKVGVVWEVGDKQKILSELISLSSDTELLLTLLH